MSYLPTAHRVVHLVIQQMFVEHLLCYGHGIQKRAKQTNIPALTDKLTLQCIRRCGYPMRTYSREGDMGYWVGSWGLVREGFTCR